MKKIIRQSTLILSVVMLSVILVACGQPKSNHDSIKALYIESGYEIDAAILTTAIQPMKNLANQYEEFEFFAASKGSYVCVFVCKFGTKKDAKDFSTVFAGTYPTAYDGVDAWVVILGTDSDIIKAN